MSALHGTTDLVPHWIPDFKLLFSVIILKQTVKQSLHVVEVWQAASASKSTNTCGPIKINQDTLDKFNNLFSSMPKNEAWPLYNQL